MNKIDLQLLEQIINLSYSKNLLKNISDYTGYYYDEPQFYHYIAELNFNSTALKSKYYVSGSEEVVTSGYTAFSRERALTKCLFELVERISSTCYDNQNVTTSSYKDLQKRAVDPSSYPGNDINNLKKVFSWIDMEDLTNNKKVLVPAQSVFTNFHIYTNFQVNKHEILLNQPSSVGGACGESKEMAILRAIYELVERDAFMTAYLNKIPVPKIDLELTANKQVIEVNNNLKKYQLEWHLFDMTNDLEIPSYLSIIIDRSGVGPFLTIGTKSGFSKEYSIIGSVEEALSARPRIRSLVINAEQKEFKIKKADINGYRQRALFWYKKNDLIGLEFLFNNNKAKKIKLDEKSCDEDASELCKVIKNFSHKKLPIYIKDIKNHFFKNLPIFCYRAVIPQFQPVYYSEHLKVINQKRLDKVADFFGRMPDLNPVPHPFV